MFSGFHPFTSSWVEQALDTLYGYTLRPLTHYPVAMLCFVIEQLYRFTMAVGRFAMIGELTVSDLAVFFFFVFALLRWLFILILLLLFYLLAGAIVLSLTDIGLRSFRWVFVGKENYCREVLGHPDEGQSLVEEGKAEEEQGRMSTEKGQALIEEGAKLAEKGKEMIVQGEVLLDQLKKREHELSKTMDEEKWDAGTGSSKTERRKTTRTWASEA